MNKTCSTESLEIISVQISVIFDEWYSPWDHSKLWRHLQWFLMKTTCQNLTFIGPCIIIYSYSTSNKMHLFLKLFILVKRSTCFGRSFRPSSGAQHCTYGNRNMSNSCWYVMLVGTKWNVPLAARSSSCLTYACCRMCSFELLMMDGKTVRNM